MAVAQIPVLPAAWSLFAGGAKTKVQHKKIGLWTLKVIEDPFTGKVQCKIRAKDIRYEHRAMIFEFGSAVNTFGAAYRIDSGPVVSWSANAMDLAAGGVSLQTDNLVNPSRGRVAVPIAALAKSHTIVIRPSSKRSARTFSLAGLDDALAAARQSGCGSDFEIGGQAIAQP